RKDGPSVVYFAATSLVLSTNVALTMWSRGIDASCSFVNVLKVNVFVVESFTFSTTSGTPIGWLIGDVTVGNLTVLPDAVIMIRNFSGSGRLSVVSPLKVKVSVPEPNVANATIPNIF